MANQTRTCLTVVLAAGEGTRMKSGLPKVLHPVAGLPMVGHVLQAARKAGSDSLAVVVGAQAERVGNEIRVLDPDAVIHEQTERKGTAHAVLAARESIARGFDDVVILFGDVPLVTPETIAVARQAVADGFHCVVLGFETENPEGYGRLLTQDGELIAIREHKDASAEERQVTLCNSGIMAFAGDVVLELLDEIGNDNVQGEYYLPDAVSIARNRKLKTTARVVDVEETLGVNDRVQLAGVNAIWQTRARNAAMLAGVTMPMPETVILHHDTELARDSTVEPNVVFGPGVTVAEGAVIRSFSHLEGTHVGANAVVGPFARLRPGTTIGAGAKIGNFVETKNTTLGEAGKINHLSYIGDADVGARANIGAGTITCNYDGANKHKTVIGSDSFIGTNTSLVAPVSIGTGAMTAAGSVVTEDVPDGALAIERSDQRTIAGLGTKIQERNRARKKRDGDA